MDFPYVHSFSMDFPMFHSFSVEKKRFHPSQFVAGARGGVYRDPREDGRGCPGRSHGFSQSSSILDWKIYGKSMFK